MFGSNNFSVLFRPVDGAHKPRRKPRTQLIHQLCVLYILYFVYGSVFRCVVVVVALTVDARVGLCRYQFIGVLNQIVFRG
jgi:hypothetical protein